MRPNWIPSNHDRVQLLADVRAILQSHRGKRNAIQGTELARALHMPDDRSVRIVIRDLIHDGLPVASSTVEPAGYYLVANGEEAAEYLAVLDSRAREDEARKRDFEKACKDLAVPIQGGMF